MTKTKMTSGELFATFSELGKYEGTRLYEADEVYAPAKVSLINKAYAAGIVKHPTGNDTGFFVIDEVNLPGLNLEEINTLDIAVSKKEDFNTEFKKRALILLAFFGGVESFYSTNGITREKNSGDFIHLASCGISVDASSTPNITTITEFQGTFVTHDSRDDKTSLYGDLSCMCGKVENFTVHMPFSVKSLYDNPTGTFMRVVTDEDWSLSRLLRLRKTTLDI